MTCVLVYNCLHNISPSYMSSMWQPVSVNPSRRCLRSAARGDLVVPSTKTVCYVPRSFAIAGPATRNLLPASLRDDQLSVAAFRYLLKTELLSRAYDSSLVRPWLLLTVRVGEHNLTTTTTTATDTTTTSTTTTTTTLLLPCYLAEDCQLVGVRRLRSADTATCVTRRTSNIFDDRCFAAAGPRLWNSLPINLRQCRSLEQFRRLLKTFLYSAWGHGTLWYFT